jgi:hypothetical protein
VKLFSGIMLVVLAIAVVTLGMTTLAFSKRSEDLTAQLERARTELQEMRGRGPRVPLSWEESLREFAGQQTVPYVQVRGFGALSPERAQMVDPARFARIMEERDRRRQAMDAWFQKTIAALEARARTASSNDVAEVADQLAGTLAKLDDLRPKWAAIRQLSDDERRVAAQRLYAETSAVLTTLKSLRDRDRQIRLAALAHALGYTGESAVTAFVNSVTGVDQSIDYNPGRALNELDSTPPAQ